MNNNKLKIIGLHLIRKINPGFLGNDSDRRFIDCLHATHRDSGAGNSRTFHTCN